MSPNTNAPVAIFVYRRPAHLRAMLDTLVRCEGFSETPIFVFSDGAKGDHDRADVLAVRELLGGLGWRNLELILSPENRGLKRSICEGVSAIVSRYGQIIVLEDDLHLSPVALSYFNAALSKYATASRVWSIAGYMFDVPQLRQRETAFFLPFAYPWGWATWDRAWNQFDADEKLPHEVLSTNSFRHAFSVNGLSNYANMLKMARDGYIDSWYIRWYYKVFMEGGVSLFPPVTLVQNRGVSGGSGTHAGTLNPYALLVHPRSPSETLPRLPEKVVVDFAAMDVIPFSWEASVLRFNHSAGSMRRRLWRRLGF